MSQRSASGNEDPAVRADRRAVAALEFAIAAPLLALCLSAAGDYGLAMWSRSCLTNAVAQGSYYAFRTGPTVTQANVITLVQNANPLWTASGSKITATATDPSLCYCPSGTPTSLGAAVTCGTACPAPDGSPAGNYMKITGTYVLTKRFTLKSLAVGSVSDTVTVRLK